MGHKKNKNQKAKAKIFLKGFTAFIPQGLAAGSTPLGQIGGNEGFGPWGNLGSQNINKATDALTNMISRGIGIMTIIAGIWFIFQFIIGAYGYMASGGDQQKMSSATKKITSALIGLIIVVAAYAIMSLLGEILGFRFLNIAPLIERVGPK
jgi:hypothetical protein